MSVVLNGNGTVQGFTFEDSAFVISDDVDSTKKLKFDLSTISPGATRTYTVPDSNGSIQGFTPTVIKTTAYTANINDLVRVNSAAGPFTVTLPASPVDGDKVAIIDVTNSCGTNAVLVGANGKTVEGDSTGLSLNIAGTSVELIYNSTTTNWKVNSIPTYAPSAFPLTSDVSGGGNFIDNVKIGNATPLAGKFTTISGTTGTFTGSVTQTSSGQNADYIAQAANGYNSSLLFRNASGVDHWRIYSSMGAAGEQSSLLFRNSATSTTLLTLDTTGNLGLGGVNPNVWSSRYKTIQGGSNGGSSMFFDYQDYSTRFFSNAIIDSANITRFVVSTTGATGYSLNRVGHEWHCAGPATANAEITGFATPKMTLDLSGNLGLGVTPSAWYTTTATTALQLPNGSLMTYSNAYGFSNIYLSANMFVNTSGNWVYTKTNSASRYEQENGVHKWYSYASGNANATVTGGAGNSMTLNASGNLNIGSGNITGVSGYASTLAISGTSNTTATASGIQLGDNYNTNSLQWGIYNGYGTTGSETGTLCIVVSNAANTNPLSNGTTALRINRSGNLQVPAMYNQTSAAAANVVVGTGGDLYRSTSALKYKQDIRDLESVDLTKFRPVRYKSKCETDDQTKDHIGFIADSYVNTYPELVAFGAGGEVEGFAYERMTAVLCKVIQQQQNMIQELADRISALENK